MDSPITDLQTKGFVAVTYPTDLRQAVERAVGAWKDFCALPEKAKQEFPYSNNADGVGYELKEGVGAKADRKENFDVTVGGKDWLTQNAVRIGNTAAHEFTDNATALVRIMKPIILDFARKTEKDFSIENLTDEVDSGEDVFFVRFIHYFGDRAEGEETATAHADQSGFTLHLFESAAGLQCLTFDKKWIDMPVSAGETVIIPAIQLQLRSHGALTALCHRVIATEETAQKGRYSAVCFVQLKGTPKYDKERCGRLQEKEAGFNYGMPHEEFIKFFKP
ncbi:MAG: 2OG-Fe(II) oxygenase family protein [bacterium]|nr:2OG-Fe(II) oxygenase family protein [bacterium]